MEVFEIGDTLKDRTDAEILAWIDSLGGVDDVLDQTFCTMREAFHAERAVGQNAIIQWDINTPGGLVHYQLDVEQGQCDYRRNADMAARVVLSIGLANFLRLVTGILDGTEATQSGRLALSGDRAFALTVSEWFEAGH